MKNKKVLLGFGLFGLVLTSFGIILNKSDVAIAQFVPSRSNIVYEGIENVTESVYSIDFWNKNTMFVTGGVDGIFYMSKIPVILKSAHNKINGGISNILGGSDVQLGNSNNITVIGGDNSNVEAGNTNATLFGGRGNEIQEGAGVPAVLLGGQFNEVHAGHDANAIVGGSTNVIKEGSQNVNILGGKDVNIYGDDVVVGGSNIGGEIRDSFVFNDGEVQVGDGSGMFLLKVANGVGFGTGTQEGNKGVISDGSVKVGNLDIKHVPCSPDHPENIGLMGLRDGCLMGCTSGSALGLQWEMLDYGDRCEKLCSLYTECTQGEIDGGPEDYVSFCTEGIVSTENSHMCNTGGVNSYHNVVFETYLIDSIPEDSCSNYAGDNQCAFQCNEHAHLTGDQTGKRGGVTMCFKDCALPWDTNEYIKHNTVITGYSVPSVDCSDGAGVHDTCKPYKSKLRCVDGTWYVANSGGEATDTVNTQYIFGTCTLYQYRCDTTVYSLTREDIVNQKYDYVPTVWRYNSLVGNTASLLPDFFNNQNIYPGRYFLYNQINWNTDASLQPEKSLQNGVRGKYELCIDYNPATPNNQAPQNEIECTEATPLPLQYHYRFTGECQSGYDLATEDNVCRKRCYYSGTVINHGQTIPLYTGFSAHCPDTCHEQIFQCYDGTLYSTGDLVVVDGKFITGTAQVDTLYTYKLCSLTGEVCNGFIVNSGNYLLNQNIGTFTSCNTYNPAGILECTYLTTEYHLESCNANYYSNSDMTGCVLCPHGNGYHNGINNGYQYVSNTGTTSITGCNITCSGGYHVNVGGGPCVACGTGQYNAKFKVSTQACEPTYAKQTVPCTDCTNGPTNKSGFHYTTFGTGINNCPWICNKNWYLSGTYSNGKCVHCPTNGSYVTDASGSTQLGQCRTGCQAGTYVASVNTRCVSCEVGKASVYHVVTGGSTSSCVDCTNGPTNKDQYPLNVGYYYTTNGTTVSPTNCQWKCSSGYYLSGTYSNGKCIKCPTGYYTLGPGKESVDACMIDCSAGTHVAIGGDQCVSCTGRTAKTKHKVLALNTSICTGCTNKPANSHYTSNGTTVNPTNCQWACDTNYYRNSAATGCVRCPTNYYTVGSGYTSVTGCKIDCPAATYVATGGGQCISCPIGSGKIQHSLFALNTSICSGCTNKPANSHYISNGTTTTNCQWACDTDYYKNSAKTGCNACPPNYHTSGSGHESVTACKITCPAGTHVATGGGQCVSCTGRTAKTQHSLFALNTSICSGCTNKPANSHYISNGTTVNPTNCQWACDTDYYRNSAATSCIKCPDGYHTIGSGKESLSACQITCPSCQHVATGSQQCVPCPAGETSNSHTVNGGSTSSCTSSCTKPANSLRTGNTQNSCCNWICDKNYYKSGNKCEPCSPSYVTSVVGATGENACRTGCSAGTHVATARNICVLCGTGQTTTSTVYVNSPNTSSCTGCASNTKPANSYFIANTPTKRCNWECNSGYYLNASGTGCEPCPLGYYTSGSGKTSISACKIDCPAGTYVATGNHQCVLCPEGKDVGSHTVNASNTSSCTTICNSKPANSTYTGNTPEKRCNWVCNKDYYRNSAKTGCSGCLVNVGSGYHSATGSTSESDCKIDCSAGTHVATARGACVECGGGTTTSRHLVSQGTSETCKGCAGTLPSCAHYTNGGSCLWACDKDCYKNSAQTACIACTGGYHTNGSGAIVETACVIDCPGATYVKNKYNSYCTDCDVGYATGNNTTSQSHTGICWPCTNGPTTGSYVYTSNGTSTTSCNWVCAKDYYLSGTNKCIHCPTGYTTTGAGANSKSQCKINCSANTYVAEPDGQCVACPTWWTASASTIYASNTGECVNGVNVCPANQYLDFSSNTCKSCPPSYTSAAGSIGEDSCSTGCRAGTHVATQRGLCVLCGTGETTTTTTYIYVNSPNTFNCTSCASSSKPTHSHFIANTPTQTCNWACDNGFITGQNGNSCVCPADKYYDSASNSCKSCNTSNGYTSTTGSVGEQSCQRWCQGAEYANLGSLCQQCAIGYAHSQQMWPQNMTGSCGACTNKPSIGAHYTGPGTGSNNCPWRCNSGYYLNSAKTGCVQCNPGYYTPGGSGATSVSACKINCSQNYHVNTGGNQCVSCPTGQQISAHQETQGNRRDCGSIICAANKYLSGNSCINCPTSKYESPEGSTSKSQCKITCTGGNHVAPADSNCSICQTGFATYHHTVSGGDTSNCIGCNNKPAHASYTGPGSGGLSSCPWECDSPFIKSGNSCICPANYYLDGNSCNPCPTNSTSPAGSTSVGQCIPSDCPANKYLSGYECINCPTSKYESPAGSTSKSQCTITCTGGNHVAPADSNCSICQTGFATYHHTVSGGDTSNCIGCNNKPAHASYTGPGSGGLSSCPWVCDSSFVQSGNICVCPANRYLSGDICVRCKNPYTSVAGLSGVDACVTGCSAGTHVETPRGKCTTCGIGSGLGGYTQHATGTMPCVLCANKPDNSHYTSYGTGINKCPWRCNSGYYLNSAQTGCVQCSPGYYTPGGSGATSRGDCKIDCPANNGVLTIGGLCEECSPDADPTDPFTAAEGTIKACGEIICKAGTYLSGDRCSPCPAGRDSLEGSTSINDCILKCDECEHVDVGGGECTMCPNGRKTRNQIVSGMNTSDCDNYCLGIPSIGAEWIDNSCCGWQCSEGYYLSGATCVKCTVGSSPAGSTSEGDCFCGPEPDNGYWIGL